MKAIRFSSFGAPDVLEYVEVSKPSTADDEMLLKVIAAGVNPIDTKIRQGSSFAAKSLSLPAGMGFDVAGKVVTVGRRITHFKVGDVVFGAIGRHDNPSSYADYAVAKPTEVTKVVTGLDPVVAAALPIAGLTAWQIVHRHGQVKASDKVLIHAGAGGVGHLAIQFAKLAGATVITTASSKNHELLYKLGATQCIDYRQEAFDEILSDIDCVMDLVGGEVGLRSINILKDNGRLVTVPTMTKDEIISQAEQQGKKAMGMLADNNPRDLSAIADLVAHNKVTVLISSKLPLSKAAQAHQQIEQKSTVGKIVLLP